MNTVAELKQKAGEIELKGIWFLMNDDQIAGSFEACQKVKFDFIDGESLTIVAGDYKQIMDLEFKLAPAKPHA